MLPETRLADIVARAEYLEARLGQASDPAEIAAVGRDYAALRPVVEKIAAWREAQARRAEAEAMLGDAEMRELAREELAALDAGLPALEQEIRLALLPRDAADDRAAILEIRPG
ncbi:MAG: PCRF domain-containing protein, partial [Pseudomonadota bacterium]